MNTNLTKEEKEYLKKENIQLPTKQPKRNPDYIISEIQDNWQNNFEIENIQFKKGIVHIKATIMETSFIVHKSQQYTYTIHDTEDILLIVFKNYILLYKRGRKDKYLGMISNICPAPFDEMII